MVQTYLFRRNVFSLLGPSLMTLAALICGLNGIGYAMDHPRIPVLSDADTWKLLPAASRGSDQQLPSWAGMLAAELPRTTAAVLQLDYAHRVTSPIPPVLRAAMRWTSADANRCEYAMACALADARRAGAEESLLQGLINHDRSNWSAADQAATTFARKMTLDSASVTDEEFAQLVKHFNEKQAASMVLLMAYSNFHDRLLLCLRAPLEPNGPLPPVNVEFPAETFVFRTTPPPAKTSSQAAPESVDSSSAEGTIAFDSSWASQSYELLQDRLRAQEQKPTRLRIPDWEEIAPNLPPGLFARPSDIIWYRIVFGYAPELAGPFELVMRTAGAESSGKWDRVFAQGLFWVTTKAVECPYCMGHCEMNWEVAGLNRDQISDRSRILASDDWSSFSASEQLAYAFARKLAKNPSDISDSDVQQLQTGLGNDRAFLVMFNASRHHYMTRISNGFQLRLEKENVFYDYYNMKPSTASADSSTPSPAVTLLSDAECWKRMPAALSGSGQALPSWAQAVATQLPRTAAAMLQLDYAHRMQSPLDPVLRAKMRWVIAHENRCEYAQAYAVSDLQRLGVSDAEIQRLKSGASTTAVAEASRLSTDAGRVSHDTWSDSDREPLEFARLLTVAAPTIPDALFESLQKQFGDNKVAAMVLLAAYGNFQDRIVLGLQLPREPDGPLAPLEVAFGEGAFQTVAFVPPPSTDPGAAKSGSTVVTHDEEWSSISFDQLQEKLDQQRARKPRLPVPVWEDVKKGLPPAMATRPTRIAWSLTCSGYVPELAVPWAISTRTMWAELPNDRIFEESLFWIQSRSIGCNYCMGHCEMLMEVAGLDADEVADRTRLLAGNDWSSFSPEEQRAYAYARKLSRTPWDLTAADYATLQNDLGPDKAMAAFWWLCRGLYMTRVSDGFQLPLERDNVFEDVPKK